MPEVIKLYKEEGETPLECLMRFRAENPKYEEVKMSYLGRLDPMAEGLLLVLVGDMRKKQEYLDMDKTYEFEVLWGVSTDTYDVLGIITRAESNLLALNPQKINSLISKLRGKRTQKYPPYSSKSVGGVQLWQLSREDKLRDIDVPTRQIKIFSLEHVHTSYVSGGEVLVQVEERISRVKGDFRQGKIIKSWRKEFSKISEEKFLISKFTADVSSGTYIRGLAHEMGEMLGAPALAWSIKRTRVGEYKLDK